MCGVAQNRGSAQEFGGDGVPVLNDAGDSQAVCVGENVHELEDARHVVVRIEVVAHGDNVGDGFKGCPRGKESVAVKDKARAREKSCCCGVGKNVYVVGR